MCAGSWNEINDRALAFSKEFADESREAAEAKTSCFLTDAIEQGYQNAAVQKNREFRQEER